MRPHLIRTERTAVRPAACGRGVVLTALAFGLIASAAACGGSPADSSGPDSDGSRTRSSGSHIELPAKYDEKDTLVLAVGASAPPQSFVPPGSNKPQGFDVDLGSAVAEVLGKRAELRPVPFDSILPALAAGKADMGLSGFTDTKERQQVVDFVDYLKVGSSVFGPPELKGEVATLADLCGRTVAVTRASAQVEDVKEQARKCGEQGGGPLKASTFPDQSAANLAVTSGRADASVTDTPVAASIVDKSNGKLVVLGDPYGAVLEGIAVPKGSGLAEPVRKAVAELIANGKYKEILHKWQVDQIAIEEPKINAGTH